MIDINLLKSYYLQHVITKIGYPKQQKFLHEEQVRVKFVKDQLSYDDIKFTGSPLLEQFVQDSSDYDTHEV